MKRFAPCCLILCLVLAAAPLAAKDTQPQFNTIIVNHFTNTNGVNQSQEFIDAFSDGIRSQLRKYKQFAHQAVADDTTVSDADAADCLLIEGKFTAFSGGIKYIRNAILHVEVNVYRVSDHVLIKTITVTVGFDPGHEDRKAGEDTGEYAGFQLWNALRKVNLSSIPAGPPVPRPVAPSVPAAATATPAAPVFASVQLSSSPAGAEITIDGAYAGNTPSLIKLRPGTHSIRIAKDGYTPWEQSIETGAGESRNLAANLEKTGP